MGIIEKPILFSGPMVRAILEGRKTQTRRVVKNKGPLNEFDMAVLREDGKAEFFHTPQSIFCTIKCPYPVGTRLWVRETWRRDVNSGTPASVHAPVWYKASNDFYDGFGEGWRPSIFMPRWACRLTLEVTDVRVERLQEISEADAIAEGVEPEILGEPFPQAGLKVWRGYMNHERAYRDTAKESYQSLWNAINEPKWIQRRRQKGKPVEDWERRQSNKPDHSWQANPWVWGYTFKVVAP